MGGGDHHHSKIVIPDYKIYKVEDAPPLLRVQEVLARQGLKDPWLRNEVWRYRPEFGTSPRQRVAAMFLRGFKYGVILTALSVIGENIYAKIYPKENHGDHH